MLRVFRAGFAILCLVLLAAGYAASQLAYPDRAAEYANWIDRPAVATAALALLVTAIVLAFIPDSSEAVPNSKLQTPNSDEESRP